MTEGLITPHGGTLINREATGDEAAALRERAASLPLVRLSSRALSDLELLAIGGLSPLEGFMTQKQYRSVVDDMHLPDGSVWSLPVTLSASRDEATALADGQQVALAGEAGEPLAVLDLEERFDYDKRTEAEKAYGTSEDAHPGVAALYAQGEVLLGGNVTLFQHAPATFPEHRLTPAQTRAEFTKRGWRSVVGFQTRNPVHRAHEYI
ncbi:MAG: sulfate adenylyltransferase, partial [Dehalococcoidia bacterium]